MNTKILQNSILYNWRKDKNLSKLLNAFNKKVEICFVGGCIRDFLLGVQINEIDFAINCKPSEVIKILSDNSINYKDYGVSHGTVTALINGNKFEITSLRKDVKTDGRYAKVEFTNNWKEDALRRDFRMNGIFLSAEGVIYDFVNGISDIKNQKISFIGNTKKRIEEDYLRILRFYRFLGIYKKPKYELKDFNIANDSFDHIKEHVSNNKIKSELIKMLKNPFWKNTFYTKDMKKNILYKKIEQWWIEENYLSGIKELDKCHIDL